MSVAIDLASVDGTMVSQVGGKAANLGQLIQAGFPVPRGVVVTVKAYDDFLAENGLVAKIEGMLRGVDFDREDSIEAVARNIKELFLKPGNELSADLLATLAELDRECLWAVRSSAVAEDLASASFAGQQDTFLNVRREDVPMNVRQCWASYWNARAISYREQAGVPQLQAGIAVVVQQMVDARSSGILFTSDPVGGRKDHLIIESSWGLGESIASGLVAPDRFVCDKGRRRVVESTINRKVTAIHLSTDGSRSIPVDERDQTRPSLTREEVRELINWGRRLEGHFGSPQDVEFALEGDDILILQSRPITTPVEDGGTLWTRGYGDEYWADVTSPLFFSVLGELLTEYVNHEGSRIMGYRDLTDKVLLKVHKGHIYFNAAVLEEVFVYNPKFSRTKELLNYFPQKDQGRIAQADTRIARRLWAEVRIGLLDPDGTIFRTDKAYQRWAAKFMEEMERLDAMDLATLSDEALDEEYERLIEAGLKHYRLIRYGMVTHSIGTNLMVKTWLQNWLDDRSGVYYSKLISGLDDNKTIRTNIELAKLARTAGRDDAVKAALHSRTSRELLATLNTDPALARFNADLQAFLRMYGHRSHTREFYFPRWADDPALIIDVVKALLDSDLGDLEKLERKKVRERKETEREVLERIGHLRLGHFKRLLFRTVLHYAQTYLGFRENQRFYLDHMILRWRRVFLEYGKRLTVKGVLEAPEDIFFLSKEEVFELVYAPRDAKAQVSERKAEFHLYRDILPPKFLRGNVEFDDTVIQSKDSARIAGTSASPGVVSGTIRVVGRIEDLPQVREGEIMVTSNTDPGWTAIFPKLGGLITETGGILSHGAVVSREYGIPAVTAVKDATAIFRTGQTVTLDGNDGTIYIVEA